MTRKQAECLALYERGYCIGEIADMLGKNHATVSNLLRRAREAASSRKNASAARCPYCASCFRCPLPDCMIPSCQIVNLLPESFVYRPDDE